MNKDKNFLDLNVKTFKNKNNGQVLVALPKRKLKKMFRDEDGDLLEVPNKIPIRLFKWRTKE